MAESDRKKLKLEKEPKDVVTVTAGGKPRFVFVVVAPLYGLLC